MLESANRLAHQEDSLLQHIGLHLSLLHAAVPDQWFAHAGDSILGPAWSLSLEWQFYLLAPLFFFAAMRGYVGWLIACSVLLLIKLQALNSGLTFNLGGFLPLKFEFFMLGMGSFFVWRQVTTTGELKRPVGALFFALLLAYVVMFFVGGMREHFFPIAIWLTVFFGALLRVRSGQSNLLSRILAGSAMLYAGRMSYVTYIFHIVVVQLIGYVMVRHMDAQTSRPVAFGVMLLLGSVLTLAGSVLIHKLVEMPGIEMGKKLRRRSTGATTPAV
jgi:peptidoglycan/LPS O-acetylase OafA/YrhL